LINRDTLPGVILLLTGAFAMLLAHSPLRFDYFAFIDTNSPISVKFLVNDILMSIFFLEIGLEIKQQIVTGHLSKVKQVILPALAACGGVLLPALFFLALNHGDANARDGWAIPIATDIAFALGIIMLLGDRIPTTLRILLFTIAVVDDLIAILVIALFYSNKIGLQFLLLDIICILALVYLNYKHEKKLFLYLFVGAILWYCLFHAGVHPTISGVITGLAIPMSVLLDTHKKLKVYTAFVILPVFAFVNAGVSLHGGGLDKILGPVPLGIAFGLIFGKQLGVYLFARLGVLLKIADLPKEINWQQFYGLSLLCGIGFTMSLFISNLAYGHTNPEYALLSKLGVLLGSTVSAILGYWFLRYKVARKQ
jgi:NhaA family Na+:H+ antiporter